MTKTVLSRPMSLEDFRACLARTSDLVPRLAHSYVIPCQSKWFKEDGYALDAYPTELLSWMEEEAQRAKLPQDRGYRIDSYYCLRDDRLGSLARPLGCSVTAYFSFTKEPTVEIWTREKLVRLSRTGLEIKALDDKASYQTWLRTNEDPNRPWQLVHVAPNVLFDYYPHGSNMHIDSGIVTA